MGFGSKMRVVCGEESFLCQIPKCHLGGGHMCSMTVPLPRVGTKHLLNL